VTTKSKRPAGDDTPDEALVEDEDRPEGAPAAPEATTPGDRPAADKTTPVDEPMPADTTDADSDPAATPPVIETPGRFRFRPGTETAVPDIPVEPPAAVGELATALSRLRATIGGATYPLVMPSADEARRIGTALVSQLDDYLLPRLARLDAPLLVVVGGSTGAGKSTLVNSLVRAPVSTAGVLRPTTRSPVLVSHPADSHWFRQGRLLPGLTRTAEGSTDPRTLQLVSAPALGPGLAFLDLRTSTRSSRATGNWPRSCSPRPTCGCSPRPPRGMPTPCRGSC